MNFTKDDNIVVYNSYTNNLSVGALSQDEKWFYTGECWISMKSFSVEGYEIVGCI